MVATERLLFTLGDKDDAKFKIFNLGTQDSHTHDLTPDLPEGWPLVPQELAYFDGVILVSVHDKLLIYGTKRQVDPGATDDIGLRAFLFAKNAR